MLSVLKGKVAKPTIRDGEQAYKQMKETVRNWNGASLVTGITDAVRYVHRTFKFLDSVGFRYNRTQQEVLRRILFTDALGKKSATYKELGSKLETRFTIPSKTGCQTADPLKFSKRNVTPRAKSLRTTEGATTRAPCGSACGGTR